MITCLYNLYNQNQDEFKDYFKELVNEFSKKGQIEEEEILEEKVMEEENETWILGFLCLHFPIYGITEILASLKIKSTNPSVVNFFGSQKFSDVEKRKEIQNSTFLSFEILLLEHLSDNNFHYLLQELKIFFANSNNINEILIIFLFSNKLTAKFSALLLNYFKQKNSKKQLKNEEKSKIFNLLKSKYHCFENEAFQLFKIQQKIFLEDTTDISNEFHIKWIEYLHKVTNVILNKSISLNNRKENQQNVQNQFTNEEKSILIYFLNLSNFIEAISDYLIAISLRVDENSVNKLKLENGMAHLHSISLLSSEDVLINLLFSFFIKSTHPSSLFILLNLFHSLSPFYFNIYPFVPLSFLFLPSSCSPLPLLLHFLPSLFCFCVPSSFPFLLCPSAPPPFLSFLSSSC